MTQTAVGAATVNDLYSRLFEGEEVKVRCGSKTAFGNLRTSLCKRNRISKALYLTEHSVVGEFDSTTGIASFKLAPRKQHAAMWEVISDD
jgi:hypothetical protein